MSESIRSLALDHITRDPGLQMRVTIDVDHVEELRAVLESNGELPQSSDLPVVFSDGRNNWLAGGHHRFEAHKAAGLKKMKCLVKPGTFRDAWLYALGANATHGLKRKQADKRKAVLAALKDPDLAGRSDNEIAKICGLNWHNLVSDVRKELSQGIEKAEYSRKGGETVWKDTAGNVVQTKPVEEPSVPAEEPADDWDVPAELGEPVGMSEEIEKALAAADQGTTGVYDAKGRPVPEDLLGIFASRRRLGGIRQELGKLATEVKNLKNGDGASLMGDKGATWLDVNSFAKIIDDAQRTLRFGSPFVVCPQCGGKGSFQAEMCDVCKGHKFLPESAYSRLPTDLRILAEQWTPKGEAWEPGTEEKQLTA